jgi:hypothetical protein
MQAVRDENFVTSATAVLDANGTTIVTLAVNPTTHALKVVDGTTGSDLGPNRALRDENFVTTIIGVSSADFHTPVPAYADANHNLMVDST